MKIIKGGGQGSGLPAGELVLIYGGKVDEIVVYRKLVDLAIKTGLPRLIEAAKKELAIRERP